MLDSLEGGLCGEICAEVKGDADVNALGGSNTVLAVPSKTLAESREGVEGLQKL